MTDIQKSPCQSQKETSGTTIIKAFITIYGSGFGCKISLKMATFRPKNQNSMTQRFLWEMLNPQNG